MGAKGGGHGLILQWRGGLWIQKSTVAARTGARLLCGAGLAPGGPVVPGPVQEGGFKAHIVSGLFAHDPLMAEDFLALGEVVGIGPAAAPAGGVVFGRGSTAGGHDVPAMRGAAQCQR